MTSRNITSLFSGIGGFEIGLGRSEFRATTFCEIDPEATAVLRKRFPEASIVPDVRDTDRLLSAVDPDSDLLTAGFPCTDLSQAGLTKGFSGSNSSLIRDVFRLLEKRPFESVLIENVPNWRLLHRGVYFREVLDALERLGYRWAYRTIDALAFGLPQRRQRIFLHASRNADPRVALFRGNTLPVLETFGLAEAAHGFYWTEGSRGLGWGENCVPTLKGGSTVGIPSPPAILLPDGNLVTPDIRDAERMQGFEANWTDCDWIVEGDLRKPFRHRRRWMLVGNAVNVRVAAWIGENLVESTLDSEIPADVIRDDGPMPEAGWFDGKHRYGAQLSTWPVRARRSALSSFLRYSASPLSLRASMGFYGRATRSSLRFVPGFLNAIEKHIENWDGGQGRLVAERQVARAA